LSFSQLLHPVNFAHVPLQIVFAARSRESAIFILAVELCYRISMFCFVSVEVSPQCKTSTAMLAFVGFLMDVFVTALEDSAQVITLEIWEEDSRVRLLIVK